MLLNILSFVSITLIIGVFVFLLVTQHEIKEEIDSKMNELKETLFNIEEDINKTTKILEDCIEPEEKTYSVDSIPVVLDEFNLRLKQNALEKEKSELEKENIEQPEKEKKNCNLCSAVQGEDNECNSCEANILFIDNEGFSYINDNDDLVAEKIEENYEEENDDTESDIECVEDYDDDEDEYEDEVYFNDDRIEISELNKLMSEYRDGLVSNINVQISLTGLIDNLLYQVEDEQDLLNYLNNYEISNETIKDVCRFLIDNDLYPEFENQIRRIMREL